MIARRPKSWWQTLPAVPRSKHAHDHWAVETDGRWRPYDRLRRVWADQTSPNDGLHLPQTERHLTCSLFENFVLHHPCEWLPRLIAAARLDFSATSMIVDAAWSYEFEQCHAGTRRSEKIADIVVHIRDTAGDALIVIEAKNLRKDIDEEPGYYLEMRGFQQVPRDRRFFIYLVDECRTANPERVAASCRRWKVGVLTWQRLAAMQIEMAQEVVPGSAGRFLAAATYHQYQTHGIQSATPPIGVLSVAPAPDSLHLSVVPSASDSDDWGARLVDLDADAEAADAGRPLLWCRSGGPALSLEKRLPGTAPQVRDYIAGVLQYLWCEQAGDIQPPAFPYLMKEPSFAECLVPQYQSGEERAESYWRLP